ncbi:MAG: amidohydrolase family protein, partial [Spirochaetales bacterium]
SHVHAPQYVFRGIGMDLPLLEWLQKYTFNEEKKYSNLDYARICYEHFVNDLKKSATTRANIYATIHLESALCLADLFEKSGMSVLLGKVNMDQNAIPELHENTPRSLEETEIFINHLKDYKRVKPIITPRFVPSCSSELLQGLGKLARRYDVPIQSHLSENHAEIDFVMNLYPECKTYAHVYDKFNLLNDKTIMAHCVHSNQEECDLLIERGAFMAHCPQSNTNIISGVAPVVDYISQGIKVALGSDVAGGANINMFKAGADAIQASKLRKAVLQDFGKEEKCLTPSQAFYMLTKQGGEFFEHSFGVKTGSFEKGYAFDAVIIDDNDFNPFRQEHYEKSNNLLSLYKNFSPEDRVERLFYLADDRHVTAKYINGECIYEKS